MPTILTRAGKASELTHNELDANFTRDVTQVTTTYQVLAADNRALIEGNHASTPFTVTMITVANAAAEDTGDFETTFFNINAAVMSIDGSGSETINGSTDAIALDQWQGITLKLDSAGAGWVTTSRVGQVGEVTITSDVPRFNQIDANAGVDQTYFRNTGSSQRILDDAAVNFYVWESIARSGTGAGVQVDTIDFTSETDITLNTPATVLTGTLTTGGNVLSDTDSTDDLGTTGVRWANLFVDDITVTTDVTIGGDLTVDSIVQPKIKIVDIGDWDMNFGVAGDQTITVAHGLTLADIRSVSALIRNDADNDYSDLAGAGQLTTIVLSVSAGPTNISLKLPDTSSYNNTLYDSTSFNRGWITITYV